MSFNVAGKLATGFFLLCAGSVGVTASRYRAKHSVVTVERKAVEYIGGKSLYCIYTNKGRFVVENHLLHGATIWAVQLYHFIQPDKTYHVKWYGWSLSPLLMFRNIVEAVLASE